jgi:GNAT superfamily N-acetyltransferase
VDAAVTREVSSRHSSRKYNLLIGLNCTYRLFNVDPSKQLAESQKVRRTAMSTNSSVKIGRLKKSELAEAERICRLAFGTFLGVSRPPNSPNARDLVTPRWHSTHVTMIAARDGGRLIGSNVVTRWGSFGFFGPLTVLPEYWDRGVGQRLLQSTMALFDNWGVRHSGLFTFPHSAKHVGLYQKFGYWPRYLTVVMTRTPDASTAEPTKRTDERALLSKLNRSQREQAIESCGKITNNIDKGLDLTGEIRAVLAQRTGDVVLTYGRNILDGFGICQYGPGSEAGEKTCYVKFGAVRGGAGGGQRFEQLLDACDAFAVSRGAAVEAGVNLAREDAYRRMRARGYRTTMQGVSMQRPHAEGFNRADAYVIDDWR